jgi:hypothetical protein
MILTREVEDEWDRDLSVGIYELMMKQYTTATEENWETTVKEYIDIANRVTQYLTDIYLNPELLPQLKAEFPVPPQRLDQFGDLLYRAQTRQVGDFLTWMLAHKDLFSIDEDFQLAISRVIVDIDAIHKQEVPPSLVVFPGNQVDVMPGSFPSENPIMEEVDAGKLVIEPVYELKYPDSRPPESSSLLKKQEVEKITEQLGQDVMDEETSKKEKSDTTIPGLENLPGILKKSPKPWPTSPPSTSPQVSKHKRLQFMSPVARFTPPKWTPRKKTQVQDAPKRETHQTRYTSNLTRDELAGSKPHSPSPSISQNSGSPSSGIGQGSFIDKAQQDVKQGSGSAAIGADGKSTSKAPGDTAVERRMNNINLFIRDLELDANGEVVHRKLLVADSELIIATRKLEDLELSRQVRDDMEKAAEEERIKMALKLAEERRLRLEEQKRREEEERRRRQEEERRKREAERREKERRAREEREAQRLKEAAERAARTGLRAPKHALIDDISEEWEDKVDDILSANPSVELTKTLDGQPLTRRDFVEKLLPETAWLNDNIIIGSILYVGDYVNKKAGATAQDPKCATFTSYFWPRLESAGPTQCGRLMRRAGVRKANFLDIESMLIPICTGSHWTLAVVLPGRRIVAHMDSLRGGHGNPAVTAKLLAWVKATLEDEFVADDWAAVDLDAPLQTNGWDCGVFAITNGLCIALGVEPLQAYSAKQLTLQRRRLAAILLNGGFNGEFDPEHV